MRAGNSLRITTLNKKHWAVFALLLVTACGYGVLVAIPNEAIYRERNPLTTSPADVGLAFENITLSPSDSELQLSGWWIPAAEPRATIVFIHGGGSNRHSLFFESLKFYRAMVDHGVGIVAIDLRNHGDSGSDGQGMAFGRTEMYDALAAITWARDKTPTLPVIAMGISMGGATVIHAAHHDGTLVGLLRLDPVLDTHDPFGLGAWVPPGLPPALFAPSAWAAATFYGLPAGDRDSLALAAELNLPILAMQDPLDPVNRAPYSEELAQRNPQVTLWRVPAIENDDPAVAWKERWGCHVAAFAVYPQETVAQIMRFIESL
jgi:pimeloyl-ACP methyl ester carboxylesterase